MKPLFFLLALVVRDPGHGYSFQLPDGFRDYPEGRAAANVIQSHMRGNPGEPGFALVRFESLGGTIGREPLDRPVVEKAARESVAGSGVEISSFEYRTIKWKSFDLELVITHAASAGQPLIGEASGASRGASEAAVPPRMPVIMMGAQVPLTRDAIQIFVMGGAADEPRLSADFSAILGSLEGQTSWLTSEERSERLGRGAGILVGILVAIGVVVVLRRRARK